MEYIKYLGKMEKRKQDLGIVKKDERCRICKSNKFFHYVLDGYYDSYECVECGSVL